jgi:hypothetical protein
VPEVGMSDVLYVVLSVAVFAVLGAYAAYLGRV